MALSANTEWDVRTTGASTNGGGFVSGASGTDYSQQNSPQYALTNGVTSGTTTVATSSASSDMVGNIAYIAGGSGSITAAWYQITAVSVGVSITVDRSTGLTSGTGVTINVGGAFATIAQAQTPAVAGNIIWIKSGTYTLTTGLTIPVSDLQYSGYGSTHGDNGTKPLITTATNSVNIFTDFAGGVTGVMLNNLSLSTTAGTAGNGIEATSRIMNDVTIVNCKFSGFNVAIYGSDDANTFYMNGLSVFNTEITGGVTGINAAAYVYGCYIHGLSGDGITINHTGQTGVVTVVARTVFNGNSHGINMPASDVVLLFVSECTFYGQSSDGLLYSGTLHAGSVGVVNSIFYGNGGYGWNSSSATAILGPSINQNNAYGSNTSGARNGVVAGLNDVSLSGDPFNNPSGGDFSLNSTAGAGAACRGAGFQL